MNKDRRKAIDALKKRLDEELSPLIDEIKRGVETILDEENDYADNMPESFQLGAKGEKVQEAIGALEELYTMFDEIDITTFTGLLDTASE